MRIKYQYLVLICFVLAGTCIGLFVGFIIAERYIPIPTMPETVAKVISHELVRINDKVGGILEKQRFSQNKWLSDAYCQWFFSLSEVEQNVMKFHNTSLRWSIWIAGIGISMLIVGSLLLNNTKSQGSDSY